jgi:hypothetical protein
MFKTKILLAGVALLFGHLAYSGSDVLNVSCSSPEVRAKIVAIAVGEVGVREDLGANDAVRIREYKRAIHSKFDYPVFWCGIFAAYCYVSSGHADVVPKAPEWVPSWSARKQYVIYARGTSPTQIPCAADVVTFYYTRLGRESHIAIIKEWPIDGDYFYTVEGNTNGAGGREGDGVYIKKRRKTDAYKIMRFV